MRYLSYRYFFLQNRGTTLLPPNGLYVWEELSTRRIVTKTKQHSSFSGFVEKNHFKDGALYLQCSNAPCNIWQTTEINMGKGKENATKQDFIKDIMIVINYSYHILMSLLIIIKFNHNKVFYNNSHFWMRFYHLIHKM